MGSPLLVKLCPCFLRRGRGDSKKFDDTVQIDLPMMGNDSIMREVESSKALSLTDAFSSGRLPRSWAQHLNDEQKRRKFFKKFGFLALIVLLLVVLYFVLSLFLGVAFYGSDPQGGARSAHGALVEELQLDKFEIWYHAHVEIKKYQSIAALSTSSVIASQCRPLLPVEFATKVSVRYGMPTSPTKAGLKRGRSSYANKDLDLLTHMLCHVANDIHREQPTRPVYVAPKMLDVDKMYIGLNMPETMFDDYSLHEGYEPENVCIMAYIPPMLPTDAHHGNASAAGGAHKDEASAVRGDKSHLPRGDGFESDEYESRFRNVPGNAFVHATTMRYSNTVADTGSERDFYYVDASGDSGTGGFSTTEWWTTRPNDKDAVPGRCVLIVNPKIGYQPEVLKKKGSVDVTRTSILLGGEAESTRFASRVSRAVSIEHNMIKDLSDPLAVAIEGKRYFDDDAEMNAHYRVYTMIDEVQQSAEAQIVVNLMRGRWNIADELHRAASATRK